MAAARAGRRRSQFRPDWRWKARTALFVLLALIAAWRGYRAADGPQQFPFDPERAYYVQRVVDGDTLLLGDGTRVRLLGVDTPETKAPNRPVEPLGPEASAFTERLVEGRNVRLEFDRERIDDYGRVLAYVFIEEAMLNEELIRAGFSEAETGFPYRSDRKRLFEAAETEARREQRGLWGLPRSRAPHDATAN